jgi:hypothetical protein
VAEDEPLVRLFVEEILTEHGGYTVIRLPTPKRRSAARMRNGASDEKPRPTGTPRGGFLVPSLAHGRRTTRVKSKVARRR